MAQENNNQNTQELSHEIDIRRGKIEKLKAEGKFC
jgi:hypothetical protein